jgi:signal transduction histidine kinase
MAEYFASHIGTNLWLPLFAVAVMEGIAVYTWQFRREPGARSLAYIQVCKAVWILALILASRSADTASLLFWMSLCQMAGMLLCLVWCRFIAQLSEVDRTAPGWIGRTLAGIVAIGWLVILTNRWHGWFWSSVGMSGEGMQMSAGPANAVVAIVALLMNLFALALCVRWVVCSAGLRRRQAWLILLASLFSWLGYILSFFPGTRVFSPLPSCFLLASVLTAWAYHRWRIFSILPMAQEHVIKTMNDGLVVLDEADCIVGMNLTAKLIFQGLPISEGHVFSAVCQAWPELAAFEGTGVTELQASRDRDGSLLFYNVALTTLRTNAGALLGRVMVFRDVTREKAQQAQIVEQQKAISALAEREHLGRKLHDGPGQIWNFVAMQTRAARTNMNRGNHEQADQQLGRLLQVVQEVNAGLRESITGLQTGVSAEQTLPQALQAMLAWYRENCGLAIVFSLKGEWRKDMISPSAEVQLLGIVQEALANVRKSADASRVEVAIDASADELAILVTDDGCGFDIEQQGQRVGHHGLRIMRLRAEEIGAQLAIDSRPGCGCKVRLRMPLIAEIPQSPETV